jgi:dTDP-4-amino-4,6-dideoxygalactose transaminase
MFGPSGRSLLYNLLKILFEKTDRLRNEVLIPDYTCYSVAAAIVKAGLKIRFYDLDPKTLTPDRNSLELNCSKLTLAVISQHLFGIPIDLTAFGDITASTGAYHIEDAAQAFGCQDHGKPLGTAGDFGLFSFGRGKPLPLGGGGALVSNHHDVNRMLPAIEASSKWNPLVITMMTQIVAKPYLYGLAEMLPIGLGETIFHFKTEDTKLALSKLLKPMMGYLPRLNTHRRSVASIYRNLIDSKHLMSVPEFQEPIYQRFPVLAKNGPLPTELRRLGVRRLYPKALHQEVRIAAYAKNIGQKLHGAETLAKKLITLPTHHGINEKIAETIVRKVSKWLTS